VTFANSSTGANYWTWNFGDGSTLTTNSSANLVHTYSSAGSYGVSLTAFGVGGSSVLTNTAYIVVTNLPPVPLFVGVPTNGAAPLTVTFTNNTTGVTTNFLWSFGDGSTLSTNAGSAISHIFTNSGVYTVSLTANGSGGSVAVTNANYITVSNSVPVAIFSGSPTNIFASQSVVFTNSSTGNGITNWIWNFGDGSSVTNAAGTNVTHAYAVAGTNTVSLTVNSPGGSGTTNRLNYIVVLPQPTIGTVALSGTNLVLSGTGGPVGQTYRILTSTNVASTLSSWTPVFTNTFTSPSGSYSYTNSTPTNGASFFILVSP
jgi:PKD repeat protein